ncbi:MAG: hypothetical protein ACTHLT_01375 [Devosia sp.]
MFGAGGGVAGPGAAYLRPIHRDDRPRVGRFLHEHLNDRISAQKWTEAMAPTWQVDAPNSGFMLVEGEEVVGVQLAFYSVRGTSSGPVRICNIAAFCVLPEYRAHSLRLLRAVLSQPGYSFTDLSPSGNVQPLNLRLGFHQLDTTSALVPNLAWLPTPPRVQLVSDANAIAERLDGTDLRIFLDHRAAQAAHHLLLVAGSRRCHIIFRRDRRKWLPLFATILHVSDPQLFRLGRGQVFRHLLLRRGILFTLLELRLVHDRPPPLSVLLPGHRPKMFRSEQLLPDAIDYLYSELTCVAW